MLFVDCSCALTTVPLKCTGKKQNPIPPKCETQCMKKLCSKHRCKEYCCGLAIHSCDLPCAKPLTCKSHQCTYTCGHYGKCHTCHEGVQFDDLECHCGRTKLLAPIACGTLQPECRYQCTRVRECGHEIGNHECHPDGEPCPPCMKFVSRKWYLYFKIIHKSKCEKSLFQNVPCSRTAVPACGTLCRKMVQNCGHQCQRYCHSGACEDEPCKEKCGMSRPSCDHACTQICHGNECIEDNLCETMINVQCECKHLSRSIKCGRSSLDTTFITVIECDASCTLYERNRKLAEALDIDVSLTPFENTLIQYSEGLVKFAHDNWTWARTTETKLIEFINSSLITHNFPAAKPKFNAYLSNYAECFGLSAEIVDENRQRKGSVILRKIGATRLPVKLLTEYACKYTTEMFVKVDTIETLAGYHGEAINCLLVEAFVLDMTIEDLTCLITPMFGSDVVLSLKRQRRRAVVKERVII